MLKKPIIVISHERSGTHFLINSLSLNWPGLAPCVWHDVPHTSHPKVIDDFIRTYNEPGTILKSHHTPPAFELCLDYLFKNFYVFYMIRDGRDVMTSCYHHFCNWKIKQDKTFSEFLTWERNPHDFNINLCYDAYPVPNIAHRWNTHVLSWLNFMHGFSIISYEHLHKNFEGTMDTLSVLLHEQPCHNPPIRPDLKKHKAVQPRKGKVGDWQNHFDEIDLLYFNKVAGPAMQKLGYYKKQEQQQHGRTIKK